jgi:CubicO group peptidase (beta-lactamase class C family)
MHLKERCAVAAALLAIAASCAAQGEPPPATAEPAAGAGHALTRTDVVSWLDGLVPYAMQSGDIAGAVVVVVKDGQILAEKGYGYSDVSARTAVDPETTLFRPGSITKLFTWTAVMQLVEQGKLDLDAPIDLPDAPIENPYASTVSLATLLEHSSGLDDMRPNEYFTTDEDLTAAGALAINPKSRVVRWEPRTRFSYSHVGYTLAGRALELAAGEPFDRYLQRSVLAPLGMHADFRRTPALAGKLATGYLQPDKAATFIPLAHRPAGAMLASANDLAKLVQLYLDRGAPLISEASMARLERNETLPFPPMDVTYGLANYGEVVFPVHGRGHNGGMLGFSTDLRYFPSLGRGWVIMLNSTFEGSWIVQEEVRREVFAFLARDKHVAAPARVTAPPELPGADYFGIGTPRNDLFAFVDRVTRGWDVAATGDPDGAIELAALQHDGTSMEVVPSGDGAYRQRADCGSSVRFTTSKAGVPVMLWYSMYTEARSSWRAHATYDALCVAFFLMQLAPMWSLIAFVAGRVARRRVPSDTLAWNAVAGIAFVAMPHYLFAAVTEGTVGTRNPFTIALCASTVIFAVASSAAFATSVRWMFRPDRPSLVSRLLPTAIACGGFGLSIWFAANGAVGLCTWSY